MNFLLLYLIIYDIKDDNDNYQIRHHYHQYRILLNDSDVQQHFWDLEDILETKKSQNLFEEITNNALIVIKDCEKEKNSNKLHNKQDEKDGHMDIITQ